MNLLQTITLILVTTLAVSNAQSSSAPSPSDAPSPSNAPPSASPSPSDIASPSPSPPSTASDTTPSNWCIFPDGFQVAQEVISTCSGANYPSSTTPRPQALNFSSCGLSFPFSPNQVACASAYIAMYCQVSCTAPENTTLVSAFFCSNVSQACLLSADEDGNPIPTFPDAKSDCPLLLFAKRPDWMPCDNGSVTTIPVLPTPTMSANISLAAEEIAPRNDFCLFPPNYIVGDRYSDFCYSASHPIAEYSNGSLFASDTDQNQQGLGNTIIALASIVNCGDLSANGAMECMNLLFDTICQALCPRKNITNAFFGYDPAVFPKSRCYEIDLRCSYFTDPRCFFNPVSKEMQTVKLGACEGGGLTMGAPVSTEPGFPYVHSNNSLISGILTRFLAQNGLSADRTPTQGSPSDIPTAKSDPIFVNQEVSTSGARKPWWYFFVIALILSLVLGASIFAAVLYKKRFIDDPEVEELLSS